MKKAIFFLIFIGLIVADVFSQNTPIAVNDNFYVNYSDTNKVWIFQRTQITANDTLGSGTSKIIDTISYNGINQVSIVMHPSPLIRVNQIRFGVPAGFFGKDSITYYLTDNGLPTGFDTATIYIYVKRKAFENLDLNNINAVVHKNVLFEDVDNIDAGFEVPKGSGNNTIFAANLWVAGMDVGGQLKAYGNTYPEVFPGSIYVGDAGPIMDSAFYERYSYQWDRVWKVSDADIQYHIANWNTSGYQPIEVIANWPANGDTTKGQSYNLAPFVDVDFDGVYNPLLGDYPKIKGQQAIYFIRNDERDAKSLIPMKLEIHGMAYSFDCFKDSALNNTVFVNYKVYNRSNSILLNAYIGLWSDLDIGNPEDDIFGCDVSRGTFYGYNADSFDETVASASGYGTNPPAQSVTFLKGPKQQNDGIDNPLTTNIQDAIDSNGIPYQGLGIGYGDGIIDNEFMGMSHFLVYVFDSLAIGFNEPKDSLDYYNYLKGLWKNGTQMTWGGAGFAPLSGGTIPTNYLFPRDSDPLFWSTKGVVATPTPWTDSYSFNTDRRGIGSCGPFTLIPDSAVELDLAFVFARSYTDTSNTAAIPIMQNRIDVIRNHFINGFNNYCPEIPIEETEVIPDSLVVFVPNVFTPNSDGLNDNFVLELQSAHLLESIKIEVFNRWGHLINETKFETSALAKLPTTNNHQQLTVWDGRSNAGKDVPSGTYYYVVKYTTLEGEQNSIKGFLTLLR